MAIVAIPTTPTQPRRTFTKPRRGVKQQRYLLPILLAIPLLLVLLGMVSCFRASRAGAAPPQKAKSKPLSGITLVIDPGHGGVDSGASRGGWSEAALTYRTASNIITHLQQQGATVYSTMKSNTLIEVPQGVPEPKIAPPKDACLLLTGEHIESRRSDDARDLWKRAEVAKSVWKRASAKERAHMYFISLHYDAVDETYVRGGRVVTDPRSPLNNLAIVLAKKMDRAKLFGPQKRPTQIIKRELGVLNPLYNPMKQKALLEIGTISNPVDRKNATEAKWRNSVAKMIVEAVKECERLNK
jgi:N-acetylmuramoyl-L-alanine amidase